MVDRAGDRICLFGFSRGEGRRFLGAYDVTRVLIHIKGHLPLSDGVFRDHAGAS
jgi:uncharacterized protein (DUF2235 family)